MKELMARKSMINKFSLIFLYQEVHIFHHILRSVYLDLKKIVHLPLPGI